MRCIRSILWALILLPAPFASAQATDVQVTTSVDESRHNLTFKVRNEYNSPIVSIEIPHYAADTFNPPDAWESSCTNLVKNVGSPWQPGVCQAKVSNPDAGVLRYSTTEFKMRLSLRPAVMSKGQVKVRFADGTGRTIDGVEVLTPPPEEPFKQWPAVFIVLIFVAWLLWRRGRSKRPVAAAPRRDDQPI